MSRTGYLLEPRRQHRLRRLLDWIEAPAPARLRDEPLRSAFYVLVWVGLFAAAGLARP